MFVHDIVATENGKLVLLAADARLIDAATLLSAGTDIIVIQDQTGALQGVVTKTDVVTQMSKCKGSACQCSVSEVMTRTVVVCLENELLEEVSLKMKINNLKNIVLVNGNNRPIGLLTARTVLRALLGDALHEEEQLIEYVSGVGYR